MPDTVPVSGKVMFNGKPLADAEVNFMSEDPLFAGFGKTNDQGNFKLVGGAVPGLNKVAISKIDGSGSGLHPGKSQVPGEATGSGGGEQLPAKYSDPEKTELEFTVPEKGTDRANFDL